MIDDPAAGRLFVVTGGPGAGKSSLVEALAAVGVATVAEAGRAVIREQLAAGGTALPWADRDAFARAMLARDRAAHRAVRRLDAPVVFDRGIPDVIGYLTLSGLPVPRVAERAAWVRRYASPVFLAPHWPAIFAQDAERRQSVDEAEATCRVMERTYARLGYELVSLPLAPVAERVALVMARLPALTRSSL